MAYLSPECDPDITRIGQDASSAAFLSIHAICCA
jgi:hypothetical protein